MSGAIESGDFESLLATFRDLGARDSESWADSELRENIAQRARYCFLRRVWSSGLDIWRDSSTLLAEPVLSARIQEMIAGGTSPVDLQFVAGAVAYITAFSVISTVDDGYDPDNPVPSPGWRLMETDPDGSQLTGRRVAALHEDLIATDPSGMRASDLLGRQEPER